MVVGCGFICGTQDIHKELEAAISDYFHTPGDTFILCGLLRCQRRSVRALLNEGDAIISDALNHASIIDACACA
jgi:glycine C-acetyltransferase